MGISLALMLCAIEHVTAAPAARFRTDRILIQTRPAVAAAREAHHGILGHADHLRVRRGREAEVPTGIPAREGGETLLGLDDGRGRVVAALDLVDPGLERPVGFREDGDLVAHPHGAETDGAPEAEAEATKALIKLVMENAADPVLTLAVPIVTEAGIADSWADAH